MRTTSCGKRGMSAVAAAEVEKLAVDRARETVPVMAWTEMQQGW